MTKQTDIEELARRFLDLWELQAQGMAAEFSGYGGLAKFLADAGISAEAAGPAAGLWANWMSWPAMMMSTAEAAAARAAATRTGESATGPSNVKRAGGEGPGEDERRRDTPPTGTTAAAASSGDGLHDLDELLCRVRALEERLAALETPVSAASGPRGKPGGKRDEGGRG